MPSFRAIQVRQFSTNFRAVTSIVEVPEVPTPAAGNVIVQNHYVGINASDIQVTNGVYGNPELPFTCGVEAGGVVTAIGEGVENLKVGDSIVYQKLGAFAEYAETSAATALKVPSPDPTMVPLMVSGISGTVAIHEVGQMKQGGENILVTSAAGSTGQYVVQLAKLAGNHVIGTCSSDAKVELLKTLGCDRVIVTTKENVGDVLQTEYPKGMDIVFEIAGGEAVKTAVENIAVHGRVILFGFMNGGEGSDPYAVNQLHPMLMSRSASLRGFSVVNHYDKVPMYLERLLTLIKEGKLISSVDPTPFTGLEGVADAIDHMYARQNIGKVVIKLV
ncbi:hypothetical protein Poli38472_004357 [Pythium oligandrum]|uniref:Enoyl reductase (ER) domain-containing protein n=1 Tax=Pythium oligandrum TaxID=41045 RepID=A0A8K1CAT6_PYTOL|nr:hypothetical protein Poli38472_004357 [Pythium oligandrum]|eukprot:TMW59288.1 hypothetical protein Poli38472_004357 [Pythium oligandrum]